MGLGVIKRVSADKSKMVKAEGERQPANFIVLYSDDSEGPHCLTLSMYLVWSIKVVVCVNRSDGCFLKKIPRDEAERERGLNIMLYKKQCV